MLLLCAAIGAPAFAMDVRPTLPPVEFPDTAVASIKPLTDKTTTD